GPAGSHAISGTWRMQRAAGSSSWTMTYKISGGTIDYYDSMGGAYHAKLNGAETNTAGGEKMSVVLLGTHKLRETYWVKNKVGNVAVYTIAPNGKTAKVVDHNLDNGNTTTFTMTKQ
ncbi:MAG TPA: hypothetical protein VJ964_15005, partial [Balneolaceae bacterium]|nr:hypothetical protein [Balneolaceae bacterium]